MSSIVSTPSLAVVGERASDEVIKQHWESFFKNARCTDEKCPRQPMPPSRLPAVSTAADVDADAFEVGSSMPAVSIDVVADAPVHFVRDDVRAMLRDYPDARSLPIWWTDLAQYQMREVLTGPEAEGRRRALGAEAGGADVVPQDAFVTFTPTCLAEGVLRSPRRFLRLAQEVLREWITPRSDYGSIIEGEYPVPPDPRTGVLEPFLADVRVHSLPEDQLVGIRSVRASHMDRLMQVEGVVKRVGKPTPRILTALFKCAKCGCSIMMEHPKDWVDDLITPVECPEDQGGCGAELKKTRFELDEEKSKWQDAQFVNIQEPPEEMEGGAQPLDLDLMLVDDLVDTVRAGDRVVLCGFFAPMAVRKGGREQRNREKRFVVVSVRKHSESYEEVIITEDDIQRIQEAATERGPDGKLLIYDRLRASVATSIIGHNTIKDAAILALFGGVPKIQENGETIRWDIHIMLAGDPGVAKSRMLRAIAALAPRGIYTSGQQASAAGLTATVVREEQTGAYALEAGALVLADSGVCAIDEMEKMDPDHMKNLTSVLEQQKVNIAKAGIIAELPARTTVISAVNPKSGKFDDHSHVYEQINLPPYILSRFFIFIMRDKPNRVEDKKLGKNILTMHRDIVNDVRGKPNEAYYKRDFVRKYIAWAKRTCKPALTDEAIETLSEYYAQIRGLTVDDTGTGSGMTARQLEDLERLAEANAKVRLSGSVEKSDAERAISIFSEYADAVAKDSNGNLNWNKTNAEVPPDSMQMREQTLVGIVTQMQRASLDKCFGMDDLYAEAERKHVQRYHVDQHVRRWRDHGKLIEPRVGLNRFQFHGGT